MEIFGVGALAGFSISEMSLAELVFVLLLAQLSYPGYDPADNE